jgi:hypothetical protein
MGDKSENYEGISLLLTMLQILSSINSICIWKCGAQRELSPDQFLCSNCKELCAKPEQGLYFFFVESNFEAPVFIKTSSGVHYDVT